MKKLTDAIQNVMYSNSSQSLLSLPLLIFSWLYEVVIRSRLFMYKAGMLKTYKMPCKVISIGNLTVGGTGKTPFTQYLAGYFIRKGKKVMILSRGYGGSKSVTGGIVSDGEKILMKPDESGDEPYLLSENLEGVPVVIGKNRVDMAQKAIPLFKPDIIILDDAYQHLKIERNLNLLLLDGNQPFGNGYLNPRGILREPKSQLNRCDAVIFTRSQINQLSDCDDVKHKPYFHTDHSPYIRLISKRMNQTKHTPIGETFHNKRVFAVSGIAKNSEFRKSLEDSGAIVNGFFEYPDHHNYTLNDLIKADQMANNEHSDCIVTTEKDYVKFDSSYSWKHKLYVVGVSIIFLENEDHFFQLLEQSMFDEI